MASKTALLAVSLALAGCGLGSGEERQGGAELRITRDFGQQRLAVDKVARVREGETVMRALQAGHRVETRYGGRFVQSIDGLSARGPAGGSDWFYFVNGIEAQVGAAERALAVGDVVQWDYRRWRAAMRVPAIVGAYPEPFLSGDEGKRIPVRVECEDDRARACLTVRRRLVGMGVPASSAQLGAEAGEGILRVVVARWSVARRVRAAFALEAGPRRSGVFARFTDGGLSLELLDAGARRARHAPAGTGLVAATAQAGQRPVWIVTGLEAAGVDAAAAALEPATLRDAFAVAATPQGPVRLPVGESG